MDIDDFGRISITHEKEWTQFRLKQEQDPFEPYLSEQEIVIDYPTAKKLINYIHDAWAHIDSELLAVLCGEKEV